MKLHLAPRLSGLFHGSAGHPAGRLQPLEVPSSAACPEGLPGTLAPLPTPSPRPPQLQVLQSSPGLTPGFPVLCDYVAGAGAEWSGRNGLSMDSVLLTGQRAAPEKRFLPSTKERIVQQPMQSREQAGESLELGSFPAPAPPARLSGTYSAPHFQSLTSHSHHPCSHPLGFTHSCPGNASLPCPSPTQQHNNITTKSIFVAFYSLVHPDQLLGNIPKLNSLSCIARYEIKWVDLLGCKSEGHPTAPAFLQHQTESEPLTRQVLLLPALFICFSHVNIFKCSP